MLLPMTLDALGSAPQMQQLNATADGTVVAVAENNTISVSEKQPHISKDSSGRSATTRVRMQQCAANIDDDGDATPPPVHQTQAKLDVVEDTSTAVCQAKLDTA